MRARIAERSLELIGCDDMIHAEDFARFPDHGTAVDFRMTVALSDAPLPEPDGIPIGKSGTVCWKRVADHGGVLWQKQGNYVLRFDDTFSTVTLTFRKGIANLGQLHYLYTAQCFAYHLMAHDGFSLHSAGLRIGGNGIALTGRSGVGKSTVTTMLQTVATDVTVLCEDFPCVVRKADEWRLFGSPFCGDDERCADGDAPLRAIVILKQAPHNRLLTATANEALFAVLENVPRPPYDETLSAICTDRLLNVIEQIPLLIFENDGTAQAATVLLTELKSRSVL